ncbi:Hypothetical protein D9617_22g067060 [Elsinoe fawcettii]|nr:Hypothetical protein D9617_22g067060 [Elsinoe fawcettii]
MRVRKPFAAAFAGLICISAYLGLAPLKIPTYKQSDKALHTITFFLLTLCFYWILETSRRRVVNITLLACTAGLSIGSEVAQGLLPNGREFDPYDIAANVLGSGAALAICSWYHKRMLERRRAAKTYNLVPGEDQDVDVELGENVNREQETGVIAGAEQTVTEQLDNWDENAEDWEDPDDETTSGKGHASNGDVKKANID